MGCDDLRPLAEYKEPQGRINQCLRSPIYLIKGGSMNTNIHYLGGNWEFGTGVARLAVGALTVYPITEQLISIPTEP